VLIFVDYNLEQQAAIIEEHFLRKRGASFGRCLNEEHEIVFLLASVLENFIRDPLYVGQNRNQDSMAHAIYQMNQLILIVHTVYLLMP
jgi:hypothetical protein